MPRQKKQPVRRKWTEKEVERLIELREKYTKSDIARIMKRSPSSISNKVRELELGGLMENTELWNFQQITEAVGASKGVVHKTWVKHGLKYVKRGYYCLVEEKELLRFMKTFPLSQKENMSSRYATVLHVMFVNRFRFWNAYIKSLGFQKTR